MINYKNYNYFIRTYRISSKSNLKLRYDLSEVIIGTLLGDSSIAKPYTNFSARIEFIQYLKNRIYIDHLYSLFQDYCGTRPRIKTGITLKSQPGKEYESIRFKTLTLPCFYPYWNLFYKFDGIKYNKIIPNDLEMLLTNKCLAYWFMDDGINSQDGGFHISTESFTLSEHAKLVSILKIQFDLNCSIHKSISGKYKLYIWKDSKEKLISLIKPHMLPHFYYKLGI